MRNSSTNKLILISWAAHGAGVFVLLAGVVAFWQLAYAPWSQQRVEDVQRTDQLRQLLQQEDPLRSQLTQLQVERDDIYDQSRVIQERMPDQPMEGEFVKRVTEIAADEGLEIIDYQRGRKTSLETHSELEIELSCQGTFASICGFVDRLEELARLGSIRDANIAANEGDVYRFSVTLVLYYGALPDLQTAEKND